MGSAYGGEEVSYYVQERAGRVKPDHETLLNQVHAFSEIEVKLSGGRYMVPIHPKTTVGGVKRFLQEEFSVESSGFYATYALWCESGKFASVTCDSPLNDSDIIYEVMVQYYQPPYINKIKLTSLK